MKKIILFSIYIFCISNYLKSQLLPTQGGITKELVDLLGCNPSEVTKISDPYLYEGECSIAINRYLSRSASYQHLINMSYPEPKVNGEIVKDCGRVAYCPENYCNLIKSMVDLKISFVQNVFFGASYHEHQLFPGDYWHDAGAQIIKDINYAYDCRGLPRPVIGGTTYEVGYYKNLEDCRVYHTQALQRDIPSNVITKYFEYFPEDLDKHKSYYFNPDGTPKEGIFFDYKRIYNFENVNEIRLDISKAEARMYFLWQAMTQIDMGYTALAMGVYYSYARHESNAYQDLSNLANAFREYANSKNTFVLLSGEVPKQDSENNELSAKVPGTNRFIFDFDSRAMRPRELIVGGSGDGYGCTEPIPQSVFDLIANSPCGEIDAVSLCENSSLMAIIDPCTIESFGGITEGYSASDPDCYLEQQPYIIHFDGHNLYEDAPCSATNGPDGLTYGYSDNTWFSNLSQECKSWWFDYFYCNTKSLFPKNGFIHIPGVLISKTNSIITDKIVIVSDPSQEIFLESLQNTLDVKKPEIQVTEYCSEKGVTKCACDGQIPPHGFAYKQKRKCYKLETTNLDCSSFYSIHIIKPDGTYIEQNLGSTSYTLCPDQEGVYGISVRQDNFGLNNNVLSAVESIYINVEDLYCCDVFKWKCKNILATDCEKEKIKVNFRSTDSQYSLIYKNETNQLKHVSSTDALNIDYSISQDISYNDNFIDVRFDLNNNSYFFNNFNNHSVVSKINNSGLLEWEKHFTGKIIKVIESQMGYDFLLSSYNSNDISVRSVEFNGNTYLKNQSTSRSFVNTRLASFSNEAHVIFDITKNNLSIKDISSGNEIDKSIPSNFNVKSIDFTFDGNILVSGDFKGEINFESQSYFSNFTNIAFILYNRNGQVINLYSLITDEDQFLTGVSLNNKGDIVYYGQYIISNNSNYYDPCNFMGNFSFENSTIIRSKFTEHDMEVYPNPFLDELTVKITSGQNDSGELILFNSLGKKISTKSLNLTEGINENNMEVNKNLTDGTYFIEFKSKKSGIESMRKIIKLK